MNDTAIETVFTEDDDDAHMDGHARMMVGSEPVAASLAPQSETPSAVRDMLGRVMCVHHEWLDEEPCPWCKTVPPPPPVVESVAPESDTRGEVTADAIRDKSLPAPSAPAEMDREALAEVIAKAGHEIDFKRSPMLNSDQNDHNRSQNAHAWKTKVAGPVADAVIEWLKSVQSVALPPSAEVEAAGPDDYRLIRQLMKSELARGRDNGLANEHAIELIDKFSALREENERLRAELATEEASCLEEIKNRDDWEERATNLANAVGEYFEVPVGEHSNINCPIGEAHKILNGEYKTKFTLRASASSEGPEYIWERGYLAGALHVSEDLGADLLGIQIPPYVPPSATNTEKADRSQG